MPYDPADPYWAAVKVQRAVYDAWQRAPAGQPWCDVLEAYVRASDALERVESNTSTKGA